MAAVIAKIAVAAATYCIDRPYDYSVPESLVEKAKPGVRVVVPFARNNRRSEGVILAISDKSEYEKLKPISAVLDENPILTQDQIKLALFMRDRFFCTVFEALKAMLPTGLWFDEDGRRKVNDKTVEMARLKISPEDAAVIAVNKRRRSSQQANLLELLCDFPSLPSREAVNFAGASRSALRALVDAELVELYYCEVFRRPEIFSGEISPLPELNDAQKEAFSGLADLANSGKPAAALLLGVTGSGKTSVYIHLIEDRLKNGKSAILLVPEIALTPQMLQTFSSHFGDKIAVLHSSLSAGERYDEWKRVKSGKASVVIGTRSAVFAPVDELGLIIIDEEQEESYKSENSPRYNARDVAKYLCTKANCLLLMASATPDVVSRYNAEIGRYSFFSLPSRYNDMPLPEVKIVDMKRELRQGNGSDISSFLRQELEENISRGEQSILFINRRGANKLISCGECGFTYKCPRCSVSLTYHSANHRLLCHYCGFSRRIDDACPNCGGLFKYIGSGTQKLEEEVNELFPGVPVMRMDTDNVLSAGSHEKLFEQFRNENIPIMVGTQMVTKGLNFENVTLVGVISADQNLYSGSYRAGERTFSLITQVIGRSGRYKKTGRAVIQTFTPENETIIQAASQNYDAFYSSEIELRKLQNAPPFSDHLAVTCSGMDEAQVHKACAAVRDMICAAVRGDNTVAVLGPAPLPVVKVNNRYRYRNYICCHSTAALRSLISQAVIRFSGDKQYKGVSFFADNSPLE